MLVTLGPSTISWGFGITFHFRQPPNCNGDRWMLFQSIWNISTENICKFSTEISESSLISRNFKSCIWSPVLILVECTQLQPNKHRSWWFFQVDTEPRSCHQSIPLNCEFIASLVPHLELQECPSTCTLNRAPGKDVWVGDETVLCLTAFIHIIRTAHKPKSDTNRNSPRECNENTGAYILVQTVCVRMPLQPRLQPCHNL